MSHGAVREALEVVGAYLFMCDDTCEVLEAVVHICYVCNAYLLCTTTRACPVRHVLCVRAARMRHALECRVQGLRFRVWGLRFRGSLSVFGFRVLGCACAWHACGTLNALHFTVQGLGFRV